MTGGEIVILGAIAVAIWAQWRSDKAADIQHEELKAALRDLRLLLGRKH